jgi:RNA polymerase sigma-70 factor (ECF subfamily)
MQTRSQEKSLVEALLAKARGGDRAAEAELFAQLQKRVTALAEAKVWDREAARDLAQDTVRTAFEKYREAPMEHGLYPWLFTILHHKVGNYLKRRRAEQTRLVGFGTDAAGPEPAAIEEIGAIDLRDSIQSALLRMTAECRKVFRLLLAGATRKELCAAFAGEPAGTVDSRIARCRSKLLAFLEGETRGKKP